MSADRSYLSPEQYNQLVWPINPNRVGTNKKGYSHVEAYEIRAHLTRVFGFARWSQEVVSMEQIFEDLHTVERKGENVDVVTCAYRAQVRLTVFAPDGTELASYTEWASGDAQNFAVTSRGDAHDFAIKTAESQAFKRCAANLGDAYGLSLYRQGSKVALIGKTLVVPDGVEQESATGGESVDAHITEQLPPEADETGGNPDDAPADGRERSTPPTSEPVVEGDDSKARGKADVIRGQALAALDPQVPKRTALATLGKLVAQTAKEHLKSVEVADRTGQPITLGALLEDALKVKQNGTAEAVSP